MSAAADLELAPPEPARPHVRITRITPNQPRNTVRLVPDSQLSLTFSMGERRPRRLIEIYRTTPWIYSSVNRIQRDIAGLPFKILKGPKRDDAEAPEGNALAVALESPNPFMAYSELMTATVNYLCVTGRTHWFLDSGTPEAPAYGGVVKRFWPLRTDAITVITKPPAGIVGYEWYDPAVGERIVLPPEAVASIAFFDPAAPYGGGLSPLTPAMLAIEQSVNLSRFNAAFLRRNASPSAIITMKDGSFSNDEERRKFLLDIRRNWIGSDNAGAVVVLEGDDVTVQPFQISHKDMAFERLSSSVRKEQLAAQNVKPAMAGDFEGTQGLGGGGVADMQDETHWQNTIIPVGQLLENAINRQVSPRVAPGQRLFFRLDYSGVKALQESEDKKVARYETQIQNGLRSPNEIREEEGREKYPGGDTRFISISLQPIERAIAPPEPAPAPAPPPPPPQDGEEQARQAAREIVRTAQWQRFSSDLASTERAIELAWRRPLEKLGLEVAARVRRDPPMVAALSEHATRTPLPFEPDHYLPSADSLIAAVLDEQGPLYAAAVARFGSRAMELVKSRLAFDAGSPPVLRLVQRGRERVGDEVANLLDELRTVLESGLAVGETTGTLVDAIKAKVAGSPNTPLRGATVRSWRIARTESIAAANGATSEGYAQAGVERNDWLSARDAFVRDSHREMDGQTAAVGSPFSNGLMYPGDPAGEPGETVNCRCTLLPVVEG